MNEPSRMPGPSGLGWRSQFRGGIVASFVLTGFGAYSMYWFTAAAIPGDKKIWWAAIAGMTAVLVSWSLAQLAILRRVPKIPLDRATASRYKRYYILRFAVIVVTEVVAINLAGPVLGHFHRPDLYPQWVDAVVGIHFFPLARLFKVSFYYATAAAITLAALGSLLIPPGALRDAITAGGTGLALWITCLFILSRNLSWLPEKAVGGV